MKKLILVMALFVTVFMNGLTAEAFPKGQQAVVGQTYFITGRNVWIRDEPNTNIAPVAAYRFGEPVRLLEVKGKEVLLSKMKASTECMMELDRIYDDVERLMESMYPNGPDAKAPTPAERKTSCAKLTDRLNAMRKLLEGTVMPGEVRNEIRSLTNKVETLIGFLNEWEHGGEAKYTPYFLEKFMPEYDRIGELYR